MNNFDLSNFPLTKLSLSVLILAGSFSNVSADTQYGPVRGGESVSSIVNRNYLTSPFGSTEIMREIFRMNPQAFINNDMGLIRRGVILTLPSEATMRRSQQQNGSVVTAPRQAVPRPREIVQTVVAGATTTALTQVRNERDQANLRLKRMERESASKVDSLSSKIEQLEAEKEEFSQQLSASETAIEKQKQSLELARQEIAQLLAKNNQPSVANNDELSEQLKESKLAIAQKQQQVAELELSVSALQTKAQNLESTHEVAINLLQETNKTLDEKLVAQTQASTANNNSEQSEANIAALNLQHQQQLNDLNSSLASKTTQLTTAEAGTKKLSDQHESETAALKSEHQKVLADLNVSFDAQLVEKTKSETDLLGKIEGLQKDADLASLEVTKLRNKNNELINELSNTNTALEALESSNSEITKQVLTVDTPSDNDANALIAGPINKQFVIQRLEQPVKLPLWGMLLGAFTLGFTSLMLLFTRRRKLVVSTPARAAELIQQPVQDTQQEKLIFRASDPSARDPDIETLRVPPRRDPKRTAILDPTMAATAAAVVTTGAVLTSAVATSDQSQVPEVLGSPTNKNDEFEAKLKLLMAEAYQELGDTSAANELLLEVKNEGNVQQSTSAASMIDRLNH